MSERFITSTLNRKDGSSDNLLRPALFSEFPGQQDAKDLLELMVRAAAGRDEPLEHILLSGPPGLGKTSLAYIIANEKNCTLKSSSGPAIEKPGDLAGLLTSLSEGDILFIDEIHRLNPVVEEYLYSAMEDFFIDIVLEQGPGARSVRLNIPHFTLLGATTRQGMLSAPLRSRFAVNVRLDYYDDASLMEIIKRSARILDTQIDDEGALELARRCRGTPRIANNLLRMARNYAQVKAEGVVTSEVAAQAVNMLKIDPDGLDDIDNRILEAIICNFNGGPVGVKNISVTVGEEEGTLEEVYEPFLIQKGYLIRTPRGRVATAKAYDKLGVSGSAAKSKKTNNQMDLF